MTTSPNNDMLAPSVRDWPSREVVAREIRRAMLDNPTDDSFNKRAEKREAIANEVADVILARFAAALANPAPSAPAAGGDSCHDPDCSCWFLGDPCEVVSPPASAGPGQEEPVAWQILMPSGKWHLLPTDWTLDEGVAGYTYRPLYATQPPHVPAGVAREEIARIIDPCAFEGAMYSSANQETERLNALAKADAVLSLRARAAALPLSESGIQSDTEQTNSGLRSPNI